MKCLLNFLVNVYVLNFSLIVISLNNICAYSFKNFLIRNTLSDGEHELRIRYNGITAKETSVGYDNGLTLRQLTDGINFIQLIYDGDSELKDCEYVNQRTLSENFLRQFDSDLDALFLNRNSTNNNYKNNNINLNNIEVINLDMPNNTVLIERVNVTFIKYSNRIPSWLLDYNKLQRQCQQTQHQIQQSVILQHNSTTPTIRRSRRSIFDYLSNVFIAPGTRWCGYENQARKYTDLGVADRTDKCCRKHDHCKVNIGAMSKRWHLRNDRPYTLSHCNCDLSFRACLKLTDTSAANMVGKLFFNIVQTKCFVIKSKRVCKKRSFWGNTCLKYGYRKQAILRDNVPY